MMVLMERLELLVVQVQAELLDLLVLLAHP
jgi:hypothetical protein